MEGHTIKCQAAKRQKLADRPEWIVDDLHAGSDEEDAEGAEGADTRSVESFHATLVVPSEPAPVSAFVPLAATPSARSVAAPSKLARMDPQVLSQFVQKVLAAFERISADLKLDPIVDLLSLEHFELKPFTSDPKALLPTGAFHSKHAPQHDAILAHLRHLGVLNPESIFVEFGAGRGTLSWVISQATGGSDHILIDRGHFRRKAETRIRADHKDKASAESSAAGSHLFLRVKADIKDFDMTKLPALAAAETASRVAVSKHLCGAATDLTLRCISHSQAEPSASALAPQIVFIALCCHHRCDWKPFCSTPVPSFAQMCSYLPSEY